MIWDALVNEGYIDGNGLVTPQKCAPGTKQGSDNGVLFTSEAMVIAKRTGTLTEALKAEWIANISHCFQEPGLLSRAPGSTEQDSVDNMVGFGAGASVCLPAAAEIVLTYGKNHWGVFNNKNPGKFTGESWLWRQPQLVAHLYFASGMMPPLPLQLAWAAAISTSCMTAKKTDADSRILSWLMIETMNYRSSICNKAAGIWTSRLLNDYENGMQQVFEIYFGKDHPIARYSTVI